MSKFSFRLAAAAGIAMLLCGPVSALAADLPPPPPPPQMRGDWTGVFIGGTAGVGCFQTIYVPSIGPDPALNGCTLTGGVLAGWNYQINDNIVIGGEGDYMWAGNTGHNPSPENIAYRADNISTIRGRVGWLDGNTLLYATAGIGWVQGTMSALVGPSSLLAKDHDTHTGFVVGGGIEHAFTPNLHARLEYLYGTFNKRKYDLSVSTCTPTCIVGLKMKDLHMVRASLTWNFSPFLW